MWTVAGHDEALAVFDRALAGGRLAHAYLLTGPPQVGKATLARDLARAVNCDSSNPPCGDCRPCRRIASGQHPDIEFVGVGGLCDEADHDHSRDVSKDIKICQVRRLERLVALRPFEGRTRVIIVDPAEALNIYAADALLKTLEEPPDQVLFLLIATNDVALPETISSRTQRIVLAPLPLERLRAELSRRDIESSRAELLARISDGRIGCALRYMNDEGLFEERARQLDQFESVLAAPRDERFNIAAAMASRFAVGREDLYALLDLWQRWWRDLLLVGEGCEDLVTNCDRLVGLRSFAASVPPGRVVEALTSLRECRRQLENNANARLALEVLMLHLPRPVAREEAGARPSRSPTED